MEEAQILDAQCIVCNEGITNPICTDCLREQMIEWKPEIKEFLSTVDYEGIVKCLFCSKGMSICAHCYSRDVYLWLSRSQPEIAEQFIHIFNYGLKEEFL